MIKELKTADYATLMNLVCGSISIYLSFYGFLGYASIFILLGVFFDFIDGKIARLMKSESELGAQLDSLSDLVTFGLAPAFLMINLYPGNYYILAFSILLPVAGAMRLARFNVMKKSVHGYFIGVPITVNGIIFPLMYIINTNFIVSSFIILIMASLMVSNIKIKKVL